MPVAVTRHRQRVDRHQRDSRRAQRRRQQAFGGLNGNRDRPGAELLLLREHAHQLAEPGHGVIDPQPDPLLSCLVNHADIVVISCPPDPAP
jgi:hypothetical protein